MKIGERYAWYKDTVNAVVEITDPFKKDGKCLLKSGAPWSEGQELSFVLGLDRFLEILKNQNKVEEIE